MNVTAKISLVGSILFTIFCAGFAISGFSSLGDITDPAQLDDARGFSYFWTFLTAVGIAFGALSLWMLKAPAEGPDA